MERLPKEHWPRPGAFKHCSKLPLTSKLVVDGSGGGAGGCGADWIAVAVGVLMVGAAVRCERKKAPNAPSITIAARSSGSVRPGRIGPAGRLHRVYIDSSISRKKLVSMIPSFVG